MSKALRTLKQSQREINRLYRDLNPTSWTRRGWDDLVHARRSLGDDVRVEAWYLAEHFLLAWSDWRGLTDRYQRYFGSDAGLPKGWARLDAQCQELVVRLLSDSALDELVLNSWVVPQGWTILMEAASVATSVADARSLFHAVVDSHRRMMLVQTVEQMAENSSSDSRKIVVARPRWPKSFDWCRKWNATVIQEWTETGQHTRDDASRHLRNYQHATLSVSWLMPSHDSRSNPLDTALFYVLAKDKPMVPNLEQFASQLKVEPEHRSLVSHMLSRLQTAIAEVGYDNFVEDVTSGDFVGGTDSLVGGDSINIIPSTGSNVGCTTLLAVAKGEKRSVGFPNVMKAVREHLIRGTDKTRVVIVLCDCWRPDMLDDHIGDLRAHYSRGVRFLFLLIGMPNRSFSPLAVDLGTSP